MPTITESKKKLIIQREPSVSAQKILEAILEFDNLDLSDFPNMAEDKRLWIQEQLNSQPNPSEQNQWIEIEANAQPYINAEVLPGTTQEADRLAAVIEDYIRNWEGKRPSGNHVDEANVIFNKVLSLIEKERIRQEENDWSRVDINSKSSLIDYLRTYPDSVHKNEIDDLYWDATNQERVAEIEDYIAQFPNGIHSNEALGVKKAVADWNTVKEVNDIFETNEYIRQNPYSPFLSKAKELLRSQKAAEIRNMKAAPNNYEIGSLKNFLETGVFTANELIFQGVITQNILDTLDKTQDLPDISVAMATSRPECKEGYTDVFFFGIPSTGKSCILMGLTSADNMYINYASGGGNYASALQEYVEAGATIPQTPMGEVATLEGSIKEQGRKAEHKINLIEMAGEEFALKIAGNEELVFDFESMGTGATELLSNDNRKAFFLIIDPTADIISYNRRQHVGFDDMTGEKIFELVNIRCNQRVLISKMVDLLAHPDNTEIMKKVDAINIIMTKADLLGDMETRGDKAVEIFYDNYAKILDPLSDLCKEYSINVQNDYRPRLYPFSLGKFYVGGFYEYDPTDSNELVDAIRAFTRAKGAEGFWGKVKKALN